MTVVLSNVSTVSVLLLIIYTTPLSADTPIATKTSDECAAACVANQACALYTYVTSGSSRCSLNDGCCWLKSVEVSGKAPTVWDPYACSAYVRVPQAAEPAAAAPPTVRANTAEAPLKKKLKGTARKNVLYVFTRDFLTLKRLAMAL